MHDSVPLPVIEHSIQMDNSIDLSSECASMNTAEQSKPLNTLILNPKKFNAEHGHCYTIKIPLKFLNQAIKQGGEIASTLLENNQILGPPVTTHEFLRHWGQGRFSLWVNAELGTVTLLFSTSDNSDPRTNGRTYTLLNQQLSHAHNWEQRDWRSWSSHSRSQYFLKRGGDRIPAPLFANLGITDICNLNCSICGSQNMMQPVNRRHMDYRIFSQVADTLFPLLVTVEFNSRGEPLLHPKIVDMLETIYDYGIYLRLQTNGTQFQSRRLQAIAKLTGEVSLSIDATGDLFEYARAGGKWPQVDQGITNLLRLRKRDRLAVNIYPTLTAKTVLGAKDTIKWAMDRGIDRVDFHQYDPIYGGSEVIPSPESLDELKCWISTIDAQHPIEVRLNYEIVKQGDPPMLCKPPQEKYMNIPRAAGTPGSDNRYTCMAPVQQVDIDLDGGVCVCCMLQERKLGNALTPEAFADCWFGQEYQAIRASLTRTSPQALYEDCRKCVKQYAPEQ